MMHGFPSVPTLAALSVAAILSLSAGVLSSSRTRAATSPAPVPQNAAPEKPNIVYLLADDLGRNDVGFMGGQAIKTPNLDKLAGSGARLDAFYVQPVCSPTRAALMTGRYPIRHGLQVGVVRPWAQYGLPLEERTLPQALKEAGYETAIVGKWHLGHFQKEYLPTRRGFDHQYGHYNGALDYFTKDRDGGFDWHRDDKVARDEGYSTHLLAKEAVRVIRERDPKKPLFLYVPFNAVHAPHQVPESYTKAYGNLKGQRKTYAGMLAAMDEAVGQILAELDARGLRKNTLIVFSSDNGGPNPGRLTDNGPFRAGKGTVYEGGVRVAACAAWEGRIRPGTTVAAPMHMVDWYPTFLRAAGASPTQKLPLDGKDILPTLTEGKPSPHDAILLNASPNGGALRMGDWKLVVKTGAGTNEDGDPLTRTAAKVELFNLKDDPYEKNDLSTAQPEKVRELRARYDAFAGQAVPPRNKPRPAGFKAPAVWGEP
jgi:arylsulfatase A-like enzyme